MTKICTGILLILISASSYATNVKKVKIHLDRFYCKNLETAVAVPELIKDVRHGKVLHTSPSYGSSYDCSEDSLLEARKYTDYEGYLYGNFRVGVTFVNERKCTGGSWGVCWDLPVIYKQTKYSLEIGPFSKMIHLGAYSEYHSGCSPDSHSHPCKEKR